jgi:hypothetical protein
MHPMQDCPQCGADEIHQDQWCFAGSVCGASGLLEKERPDIMSGRTLTRPPLARADSATGPEAIMRQLSAESQRFEQQFWWFSNDHAETLRIV